MGCCPCCQNCYYRYPRPEYTPDQNTQSKRETTAHTRQNQKKAEQQRLKRQRERQRQLEAKRNKNKGQDNEEDSQQKGCCYTCCGCIYRYDRPEYDPNRKDPKNNRGQGYNQGTGNATNKALKAQDQFQKRQRQQETKRGDDTNGKDRDKEKGEKKGFWACCCSCLYRYQRPDYTPSEQERDRQRRQTNNSVTTAKALNAQDDDFQGQNGPNNNKQGQNKGLTQDKQKNQKKGCSDFFCCCCLSRYPRPEDNQKVEDKKIYKVEANKVETNTANKVETKNTNKVEINNANTHSDNYDANKDYKGAELIIFDKEYDIQPRERRIHSARQSPVKMLNDQSRRHSRYKQSAIDIPIESERQIEISRFKLLKVLGEGGLGNVYLVCYKEDVNKKNKQMFALRQMKKSSVKKKDFIPNILFEKKVFQESRSDFITRLHSTFRDSSNYFEVLEWARGGDVQSFIEKGSPRIIEFIKNKQNAIRFILGCAILGLEYLHERNIAYSNLKPSNLLVFSDGYVKLSDFDVSIQLKKDVSCTFKCGTTEYFAPEMAVGAECKRTVDMWALGVLAYQLSTFEFPFGAQLIDDGERFVEVAEESERHRHWHDPTISFQLKDLINRLLRAEPRGRLGVSGWRSIKNHNFFKMNQFNWNALELKAMNSPLLPIISKQNTRIFQIDQDQLDLQDRGLVGAETETAPDWTTQNDV